MNPKGILWVSFFFNAASFFFTLRLRYALLFFSIFLVVGILGNYLMAIEFFPQPVEFCLVIVFLFLPVVLNAIFLSVHESRLKHERKKGEQILDLAGSVSDLVS